MTDALNKEAIMGFLGGGRRRYWRRFGRATELFQEREYLKARLMYEDLAPEALRLWGPDHIVTLLGRASLANTYLEDDPAYAQALLEEVVRDCERVYDTADERTLPPRFDLAAAAGAAGDFALCNEVSEELVGDCRRLLGDTDDRTQRARDLVAESADDLAQQELRALLSLDGDSLKEDSRPADWGERLRTCAAGIEAARTYRALLQTRCYSAGETGGAVDHALTYVRPDTCHVRQYMWDDVAEAGSEDAMYDEWTIVDGRYYEWLLQMFSFAGDNARMNELGQERHALNRLLLADGYAELMRGEAPTRTRVCRGDGWVFLVAEYEFAPRPLLASYESLGTGRTELWIDLEDNRLRKATGTLRGRADEDAELRIEFRHGFTSYDESISISAPVDEPGVQLRS